MNQQRESVEDFWRDMSTSLCETVLAYTLGQYQDGADVEGPLWGIFFLTETRFFFRHFPQTSWIESLISQSSAKKEEISITYPLEGTRLSEPGKPTFVQRILGSGDRTHRLHFPTGETLSFTIEAKPDDFIHALRDRLQGG